MGQVILLNMDYSFLNRIRFKDAMRLIVKGKAEIVKGCKDKIVGTVNKAWTCAHPIIIRLLYLVRTIYKAKVRWSPKNVFLRDNYTCQYCGKKTDDPDVEHIIPKSRGGKKTFENCVCACRECNQKKGDKTPREANMFLIRQPFQPTIAEFIHLRMKQQGIDELLHDLFVEMELVTT